MDLVRGGVEVLPNLRKYLSRAWEGLTQEQKENLAGNLPQAGPIIGKGMKLGTAVAGEAAFLGLPGIKVALESGRVWYWDGTDLDIKSLGHQGGFSWYKEAIDILQNQELGDELFRLPVAADESSRLQVSAQDREWAGTVAKRIVDLLARPLQGREDQIRIVKNEQASYKLPVPWPFPPPPGYETTSAQYRLDPTWVPYPEPPDRRPWPPPGLGTSILKMEAQEIAEYLAQRLPHSELPEKEKP